MGQKAAIDAEIAEELKNNRYQPTAPCRFTAGAGGRLERHRASATETCSSDGQIERALPKGALLPAAEGGDTRAAASEATGGFRHLDGVALRSQAARGHSLLYQQLAIRPTAGNTATAGAMMWSAASVAGLLFFLALILYFQHRYQFTAEDVPNPAFRFDLAGAPLTPSQRAAAKYFVIALALFLVQCLLGGKMAHDYADGAELLRLQPLAISAVQRRAHLAPATRHLLDRDRVARHGHFHRAAGERARTEGPDARW